MRSRSYRNATFYTVLLWTSVTFITAQTISYPSALPVRVCPLPQSIAYWVLPSRGIVVERSPFRSFAFFQAISLTISASLRSIAMKIKHLTCQQVLNKSFATFTLNFISCLRCSSDIFRSFQQFKQYWIALCLSLRTYFYIRWLFCSPNSWFKSQVCGSQ